jgi:hypothetical protein
MKEISAAVFHMVGQNRGEELRILIDGEISRMAALASSATESQIKIRRIYPPLINLLRAGGRSLRSICCGLAIIEGY